MLLDTLLQNVRVLESRQEADLIMREGLPSLLTVVGMVHLRADSALRMVEMVMAGMWEPERFPGRVLGRNGNMFGFKMFHILTGCFRFCVGKRITQISDSHFLCFL
ncbi:hypothetical protein AVEN_158565-1 [Araneus ventricosus]|uniref:Uncharacterized protein n=1 Tax=Araneus ventricosus TaxID=182803 RepID=A0A4Y2JFZ0_ARAVE|nr:hypothetical protein AVEN_22723-1 [Araneus ventricosus]GBM88076.1 hypothetical protein AVEN_158565-1 [Araneus ventricosus]